MLTIKVNCDSDVINLKNNDYEIELLCNNPYQTVNILKELLNMIPDIHNVRLEKINEGETNKIEEW